MTTTFHLCQKNLVKPVGLAMKKAPDRSGASLSSGGCFLVYAASPSLSSTELRIRKSKALKAAFEPSPMEITICL